MWILLFLLLSIEAINGCDITVRVVSKSDRPYYVQVQTANGQKSPLKLLKSVGGVITYRFIDTCAGSTIVSSYQSLPPKQPVFQNSALIGGNGQIDYSLTQKGSIHIEGRVGISCAFSDCIN